MAIRLKKQWQVFLFIFPKSLLFASGFEKFQRVRKTGNSVEIKNEKTPAETTTNVKAPEKKPQEETLNQTIEKPNEVPKEENLKGNKDF